MNLESGTLVLEKGSVRATPLPEALHIDLGRSEYLRQRSNPRPGDQFYLHLSDLLTALKEFKPDNARMILDYGSGGSPYRSLFGDCVYHRADLVGGEDLDFSYQADARLPPEASNYDCVLSTQVLEHVEDPDLYLRECYRVLQPGGRLILTTHGLFEDHGCPHDYWRWTVYGLMRLIERAGFEVAAAKKLTTGPRCAVFLAERELRRMRSGSAGGYGKLFALGIQAVQRLGARRRHEWSDASFPDHRVVDIEQPDHDSYVAIAISARR
jgi:SAM-dependent methyltransferase